MVNKFNITITLFNIFNFPNIIHMVLHLTTKAEKTSAYSFDNHVIN